MILIDNAPYSIEIWCWYNQNKHLASIPADKPIISTVFKHLFPPSWNYKVPRDFNKLNLGEFWNLLWDIFMLASGLSKKKIDKEVTLSQLRDELVAIKSIAIRWALRKNIPESEYGDYDHLDIDKEKGVLKQPYRYRVYYMLQIIFTSYDDLSKNVECELSEMPTSVIEKLSNTTNPSVFYSNLIREKSKGDLDEFIIYTMQYIQFNAITPFHEKMALLERYIKTDNSDFEARLSPSDTWRFLFPSFFDGFEDVYDKFFNEFSNECVLYFLSDYLSNDYGIRHAKFYNLYFNSKLSDTVFDLISQRTVLKDIVNVEKSYM